MNDSKRQRNRQEVNQIQEGCFQRNATLPSFVQFLFDFMRRAVPGAGNQE
jgi:hypothetical protein